MSAILADATNLGLSRPRLRADAPARLPSLRTARRVRFAPRIRDLADKRLYISGEPKAYPTLSGLIGGMVEAKRIRTHWDEIREIQHGFVEYH